MTVLPAAILPSGDDGDRLMMAGGRVEVVGNAARMVPQVSRSHFSNVRFGTLPHATGYESHIAGTLQPGSKAWDDYFSTRKIVERVATDGTRLVSVTSNLFDAMRDDVGGAVFLDDKRVGGVGQKRVYSLAQLLTDECLMRKFDFSQKQIITAKTMALSAPDAAAGYMQSQIRANADFKKYEVHAGKYSRSKRWAKDSIAMLAAGVCSKPVQIDSSIVGGKLFLYAPPDSERKWYVFGPLWYAHEVMLVYSMVLESASDQIAFTLGAELTILDIDIWDGNRVVCPTLEMHAGPQDSLPEQSSQDTEELLSAEGKLKLSAMASSVDAVEIDGVQMACAVRVSDRHVLVNAHVVSEGAVITVGGQEASPVRMLARDLWLVKSVREGFEMSWTLRESKCAESVVVCYLKGSQIQFTSPITVRSDDGATMVMSLCSELSPGMSGGAVIALSDMAMLGVYSGVGAQVAVAAVFSPELFTDICVADRASEASRSDMSGDGSQYVSMKQRGLGKIVDQAISALVPVYEGLSHVGMAVVGGGKLRTTCDAGSMPLTVGARRQNVVFQRGEHGDFYVEGKEYVAGGPMLVRSPQHGEKVFVVGRDSEGPYTSDTVRVVHVGVASESFVVSAVGSDSLLALTGGLVIGKTDGAVVGQYCRHQASPVLGEGGFCVALPRSVVGDVKVVDVAEWLTGVFPMLHPTTWADGLLEEVFTHSSAQSYPSGAPFNVGNSPLAFVGDSALKLAIGLSLRSAGIPHAKWQTHIQARQTDVIQAGVCERFHLQERLVVGRGVTLARGAKAYASLLEALVGAVYLSETFNVFHEFCLALGMVSEVY